MKWLVILALLLPAGCGDYTGQVKLRDLSECQLNADKVYPRWRRSADEDEPAAMGDFVELCMFTKGYVGDNPNGACATGTKWVNQSVSFCYRKPWPWEHV